MKNRNIILTTILLTLGSVALPQGTQAVVPAPDGGYPNFNTAEGQNALFSLTTGVWNTALGAFTLRSDTDGSYNTAVGTAALLSNTGNQNTTTGVQNTAVGAAALLLNTTGTGNTGVGADALLNNTTGGGNTAIGSGALFGNTANGFDNTAIGASALSNNTTGDSNIALGAAAGSGVTTANNVICIGIGGNNVDNACYIGQIFGSTVSASAVFVNSNGRLGTMTSSKRFKQDIKPMDDVSEALYSLKPVSFRYKKEFDPAGASQLGLMAEDVEKIDPDLVVHDKERRPYSVRYEQVNAMLLNEFLKEHRKMEKLQNDFQITVAQQQKEIRALTAQLKEQAAQIHKVSAQVQMNKPAPQMVVNP